MKTTLLLTFILALMGAAVGLESEKMQKMVSRLLGRTNDHPYSYSVAVRIGCRGNSWNYDCETRCTGALLKPDIVLTAGHCFRGVMQDRSLSVLIVGDVTNDLEEKNTRVLADKLYMLKTFQLYSNITDVDDIAIIKTKQPLKVKKNSPISLIELPLGNEIINNVVLDIPLVKRDNMLFKIVTVRTRLEDSRDSNREVKFKTFHGVIRKQPSDPENFGFGHGDSGAAVVFDGKTVVGVICSMFYPSATVQHLMIIKVAAHLDFINGVMNNAPTGNTDMFQMNSDWDLEFKNGLYRVVLKYGRS
ncbi:uncharacterized protein LOC106644969 [Copidosoma floridanum]|uniref:uncharacterized protein LOC106644969 n=1 Tax=Copidosoma floridanum TaxID=29053 RepID=UPI0006C9D5D2|nr:uncharacterized protein LOC106644969 [Copidosoma floridanum]